MKSPVIASPRRAGPVLVCTKCLKRSSKGDKIRRTLKRQLRHRQGEAKRAPKLVGAGCFGICPKKAVVLANGHSLHKGEYVLVTRRNEVEEALDLLQLSR